MSNPEKSFQQVNPVGGYSLRPVTLGLGALSFAYGIVVTATQRQFTSAPFLDVASLVLTGFAILGVVFWSSPLRAPFPVGGFAVVIAAGCGALVCSGVAESSTQLQTGVAWAPVAYGLLVTQLAFFRPARQLVIATVIGATVTLVVLIVFPTHEESLRPASEAVVEIVTPIVALGFASVAFAVGLQGSRNDHATTADAATGAQKPARHESEDGAREKELDAEVVPLFERVVADNAITEEQAAAAIRIGTTIRQIMISDISSTWLHSMLDDRGIASPEANAEARPVLHDPEFRAVDFTTSQRTAVRALVVALSDHPGFVPESLRIGLTARNAITEFHLSCRLMGEDSIHGEQLAPYLALLKMAVHSLEVGLRSETLTLRFWYEHR